MRPPETWWALRLPMIGALLLFAAANAPRPAAAQSRLNETIKPVEIVQIYGRDTLTVGELETYRVRVNSPYEVAYSWSISDGVDLRGNPIVYRFDEPGQYRLVATARNPTGADSDTLEVLVLGKRPPTPPPVAQKEEMQPPVKKTAVETTSVPAKTAPAKASKPKENESATASSGLKNGKSGNYTWVIATYFQRSLADALANSYRAVGFRSAVLTDSGGKGSTVFRVTLGQFESEQQALDAKGELRLHGIRNPLLHRSGGPL